MNTAREVLDRLRGTSPALDFPPASPTDLGSSFKIDPGQGLRPANDPATAVPPPMNYQTALTYVAQVANADPVMMDMLVRAVGVEQLRAATKPRPSLKPFPSADLGTAEMSIWDNAPFGAAKKLGNSRDPGARFAVSLKATVRGHRKPLTGVPDFSCTADLYDAKRFSAKLRQRWKDVKGVELDLINDEIMPRAVANDMLIGRCFYAARKNQGGGKHFFKGHYVLVEKACLMSRELPRAFMVTPIGTTMLPMFDKLDGTQKPFPVVSKIAKDGTERKSVVVLQSRSSDLASLTKTWATGAATSTPA
jgi:hypothetical protein